MRAPETEGIKYAGSKLKLLPRILKLAGKTGAGSVFDGFSGSTRISQAFARRGYRVVSNDAAAWSKTFATCYLLNKERASHYRELIQYLNAAPPRDGWFTERYGGDVFDGAVHNGIQPDGSKKPWQKKNTRKLDGIREEIDQLNLDQISKSVALTSLILALDRVDNTLGHFASYLKDWSPRSFNDMEMRTPKVWVNERDHLALERDVFDALEAVDTELAYYDPPYGSNNEKMPPSRVRYASYYHVWTTIVRNDRPPLFGKAMRRKDTSDQAAASVFEDFRRGASGRFAAVEAIDKLISKTPCEWIILSYSSGGRATAAELHEVIRSNATLVDAVEIDHRKNVMAAMRWTHAWLREAEQKNREFLFLMRKR